MWAGEPADKTQCPTCLKKFAHASARNTHVKNGCPATKPGGESELAKRTRQLEREKTLLQERLREQDVNLRAEAARAEKAKLAGERAELTEYRKFYDDGLEEMRKKLDAQREHIKRLEEQLKARPTTQIAAGGAGGSAAGRDVDNSHTEQNIVLNIYGGGAREDIRALVAPLQEGLLKALRGGMPEGEAGRKLLTEVVRSATRKSGVLQGWDEERDEVGVRVAPERWEERKARDVAHTCGKQAGRELEKANMKVGNLGGTALASWAEEEGGGVVRRVAVANDLEAQVTRVEGLMAQARRVSDRWGGDKADPWR